MYFNACLIFGSGFALYLIVFFSQITHVCYFFMFVDLVGVTSSFLQQFPSFLQLFLTLYTDDAYFVELQLSFCVSVTFLC